MMNKKHLLIGCVCLVSPQVDAQENDAVVIQVPDLTVVGAPPAPEVVVAVPDLVIVGTPPPPEVVIDLPDLVIVGTPPPPEVVIDVPDMVIVGTPPPQEVVVTVGDLTIVGRTDRESQGNTPDAPEDTTDIATATTDAGSPTIDQTWCNGTYEATLSKPRFVPSGPPIGRIEVVTVEVEARDCAQTMIMTPFPGTLTLTRGADDVFVGNAVGDGGQTINFSFTCQPDLSITGGLEASDGNMTIRRDLELARIGGPEADLSQCPAGSGHLR